MIRIEIPGPRILALDIAFRTGYAVSDGPGGMADFRGDADDYAKLAWRFSRWLADLIVEHEPGLVVIEHPLTRGQSSYPLNGLVWDAHKIAYAHDRRRLEVTPDIWRKGLGLPCRRKGDQPDDYLKRASMAYVVDLGYEPASHDEADARCIALWAERQFSMTEAAA